VRLLDTLAVCYRGRRIGFREPQTARRNDWAEGAVDVCFGSLADMSGYMKKRPLYP
jgi:hypothetical protein